jgi:hypothetical protein
MTPVVAEAGEEEPLVEWRPQWICSDFNPPLPRSNGAAWCSAVGHDRNPGTAAKWCAYQEILRPW